MKQLSRLACCLLLFSATAAEAQSKKTLKPEDYGQWQTLTTTTVSDNGKWAAWQVAVQKDNDSLYVENLESGKKHAIAFASGPVFSGNNEWMAYRVGVSYKEAEKLQEQKKPVEYATGFMHLASGRKFTIDNAGRHSFSKDGRYLAIQLAPPKGNTEKGSILLLRNLADSSTRTIGNVTDFAFSKKGDLLAYIVTGANPAANSVELFNLNNSSLKVLASDTTAFKNLTWQKDGEALAFMQTCSSENFKEPYGNIHFWAGMYKTPVRTVLKSTEISGLPGDMRIDPNGSISISEDMNRVFFGTNKWTEKPKKDTAKKSGAPGDSTAAKKDSSTAKKDSTLTASKTKKEEDLKNPEGLDIWHWKDREIQPRQKITYNQDRNATFLAVYNLDSKKFIQLADSAHPNSSLTGKQAYAVVSDEEKYKPAFKEDYADYFMINTRTGEKTMLAEKMGGGYFRSFRSSPDGKYLTYYADSNWWVYDIPAKQHRNLTKNIDADFWNTRDDHPATKPPFGMAGWTKGDKELLVYDEYDAYAVQPDGKKFRNLTNSAQDEIMLRIVRTDYEEEYIDDSKPILLQAYGEKTKKSGYYQLAKNQVTPLVFADQSISRISKAKDANVFTYVAQTFSESPALLAVQNNWQSPDTLATTNPQQEQYAWGKSELVNFTSKKGQKLQGALFYPADYQPGKKYPMVVYIYEILSNTLHSYVTPSERAPYNTTNYTTNGYFVFRPDIVYELNDPGMSAVDCVVPAVEEVLKTGMIDKDKVGIMGHSWGAYQTSFIITQTNLFKAAIAGAPLTDLVSMSMSIYWNSGVPDQKIFETSQGRFDGPWYERMDEHVRNSPMFQAKNINTPLMVAFGDKDGAVDWHQGIEMYGTLRRMEKPHIMLVYADENHSLSKKENQIDYQKRQMEFFGHYLTGEPAPKWIKEGMRYAEKMKK